MKTLFYKTVSWIKRNVPIPALFLYAIALFSCLIHIICLFSTSFAEFFSRYIAGFFRMLLAKLSGIYRFSFAEILVILIPVIFVGIIAIVVVYCKQNKEKQLKRFFAGAFAIVSLFYSTFVFTYGMAYRGYTLDQKMDLNKGEISVEELEKATLYLLKQVNQCAQEVDFIYGGASVMPYNFDRLNEKLNDAYASFADKHDVLYNFRSKVKPMLLAKAMSYIHMLGMYTYYTGEANINIDFPDYTIPFTVAHEMAHQRGIAREDEANFMAFLVGIESDDPYIRYCAYMNMYEYTSNALYRADANSYYRVYRKLCTEAQYEMQSYNVFFKPYENSGAAKVSDKLNDAFLKGNGQSAGTASYGLVVDLAVAYIKKQALI